MNYMQNLTCIHSVNPKNTLAPASPGEVWPILFAFLLEMNFFWTDVFWFGTVWNFVQMIMKIHAALILLTVSVKNHHSF